MDIQFCFGWHGEKALEIGFQCCVAACFTAISSSDVCVCICQFSTWYLHLRIWRFEASQESSRGHEGVQR